MRHLRLVLRTIVLSSALTGVGFAMGGDALAQVVVPPTPTNPIPGRTVDRPDHHSLGGWIGLFGLAGLIGLAGRNRTGEFRSRTSVATTPGSRL